LGQRRCILKVLKSGVEMTPEEMRKSRGGLCACGCGVGVDSDAPSNGSESGSGCYCSCEPPDPRDPFSLAMYNTLDGTRKYIYVY